jgi:long-chain acyl-CoA synthetase
VYLREVKPHVVFGVPRVWEKLYGGVQAAVSASPERAQKLREAVDAAMPLVERIQVGTATDQDQATYQFLDEVAFKNLRSLIGLDEAIIAMTGAAPMQRELQLWFRAIGVPISDIYGMSECCGPMTWAPLAAKPGTVGKAMPGVEVKLAEDGEIICRGGNVFGGYLKSPGQTADALDEDGWLHSGDIGQLDEDGYFRIVDRKKELIITAGGKNISPANLEAALKSIPLVGQACAIGDDRPFVSALIVLDPDVAKAWAARRGITSVTLEDLSKNRELIAEVEAGLELAMASFNRAEKVKRIKILGTDWLPDSEELTPTSKLKRRTIHAKYKAEIEEFYATTLAPPAQAQEEVAKPFGKRAAR